MNFEIIPFDPQYSEDFKRLNISWLERYFHVEPRDEEVLGNPEKFIINPGGRIFFATIGKEIIGTVALLRLSEGTFELTKMAVTPQYQGKKVGQGLLEYSIAYSRKQQWKELILYSNRKLENAIHLYRKYGFREIPIEADNPYARGDIKMELKIN
ncbi:MAG TPA: GNAT family N-acetyltransferase [Salinimicrobium sp.]|nr:GNAT family N-acetyltransferase [Salinimicrobium sp.]